MTTTTCLVPRAPARGSNCLSYSVNEPLYDPSRALGVLNRRLWHTRSHISHHQLAAIDLDRFANHKAGQIRREKGNDFRAILRGPDAAQRNCGDRISNHFGSGKHLVKGSVDGAGRDRIDANAMWREFFRLRL